MTIHRFAIPLAAVALIATSTPAFAANDPKGATVTVGTPAAAAAAPAPSARKRFCLSTKLSNDDKARKVCKSYAEWQRQGIDPRGR